MSFGVLMGLGVLIVMIVVFLGRWHGQRRFAAGQALLAATERGDLEHVQTLLQRANVNVRNVQGWTPLHIAVVGGDVALVEFLLRNGADVNAESYIGATALDHAITYRQHPDVVRLLQARGAIKHANWDDIY